MNRPCGHTFCLLSRQDSFAPARRNPQSPGLRRGKLRTLTVKDFDAAGAKLAAALKGSAEMAVCRVEELGNRPRYSRALFALHTAISATNEKGKMYVHTA